MARYRFLIVFTSVAFVLASVGMPVTVAANVNDFDITNFKADYYINKQSPHGAMRIREEINVIFRSQNHGILRAIPASYNGNDLDIRIQKISRSNGSHWPYTTYNENGNTILKIGDPNQTVTGAQTFILEYSVQNVTTFFDTHDEVFWDINGDQWLQPFLNISATFHFEDDITLLQSEGRQPHCITGAFGSRDTQCTVTVKGTTVLIKTNTVLQPGQNLSVVMAFQKGTFQPYTWIDTLQRFIGSIILSILAVVLAAVAFRKWWLYGKDYSGKGVIVPEYKPPKGIDVLTAGVLQDYTLDNKDITAAIVHLAVRGYIKIKERDSRRLLLMKKTETSIQLTKTPEQALTQHEKTLLAALFPDGSLGSELKVGSYNANLTKAIEKLRKEIYQHLADAGLTESNPKKTKNHGIAVILFLLGVIIAVAVFTASYLALPVAGLAVISCLIMLANMSRRSHMGVAAHEQLLGLKMYLNTSESERLKLLQGPKAAYAENANEPVRDVKLFEKLLPFAIILGVEKGWARQFDAIYTQPPDWYEGNWRTFNTVALTSHISSSASALSTSFTPPSSSGGSSGFSGGGFSGGGGGGGGGGGW